MVHYAESLAVNVRRLRETHGLSLSQLGERSGIAKATLFKVERSRTNPTLDTLIGIADAFDVPLTELLAIPDRPSVDVVRAGEGDDISDDRSDGFILRSQVIGAGIIEIHDQTFHGGVSEISASHGTGAREHVFARAGRIEVGPVGDEVVLDAGDYATYSADGPHRWHAIDGPASVWIVHSFPRVAPFPG